MMRWLFLRCLRRRHMLTKQSLDIRSWWVSNDLLAKGDEVKSSLKIAVRSYAKGGIELGVGCLGRFGTSSTSFGRGCDADGVLGEPGGNGGPDGRVKPQVVADGEIVPGEGPVVLNDVVFHG